MKKVNIELTEATAFILRGVMYFAIDSVERTKAKDPLKDNDYILRACEEYLEATKELR